MNNLPYPTNQADWKEWARALVQKLQEPQANNVPTGTIVAFVGGDVPDEWLVCQGQLLKSSDHPGLWRAVGTSFNTGGEAAGSFRLPDGRGRAFIGLSALITARYGQGILSNDNFPRNFPVSIFDPGHYHSGGAGGSGGEAMAGAGAEIPGSGGSTGSSTTSITAKIDGVDNPKPLIPPYFGGNWIIKA